MHEEKVMKMLLSSKNSNRMFLIQDIVLIIVKFCEVCMVLENKRRSERNIYYLK